MSSKNDKEFFARLYGLALQSLATNTANQEAIAFILNSLDKKPDGEHIAILRQRTSELTVELNETIGRIVDGME